MHLPHALRWDACFVHFDSSGIFVPGMSQTWMIFILTNHIGIWTFLSIFGGILCFMLQLVIVERQCEMKLDHTEIEEDHFKDVKILHFLYIIYRTSPANLKKES